MLNKLLPHSQSNLISLITAFAAGASTSLSFAPYGLWLFMPVALTFALWQSQQLIGKHAFRYWLSFGFGSFAVGISWVHVSMATFGGLPLVVSLALMAVLSLYLGLYPALAGYLLNKIIAPKSTFASYGKLTFKYLGLFPALWVLTEWLRGWVLTGFPWLWIGYSQTNGPLSELASLIGALGLSFVLAIVAGAVMLTTQKRVLPLVVVLSVVIMTTIVTPYINPVVATGKSVKVALVQGNIAQSMKWEPDALWPTMLKFMDLTRNHFDEQSSVDIVIWPEAAIPAPEAMVEDFLLNANQVANLNNTAIITGIISREEHDFYNSLIVLGNHHSKQQPSADYQINGDNEFRKHHLLPIGEFVPFAELLRPLAPFFNLPMSSFQRGDFIQPNLTATGYKVAPAICYEIVFPEQVRDNTHADTDLLLTVSNDAWFGTSNGPLQHMEIAQMRAIEMGKPLLRATNNGVTAIVDPYGNITDSLPQFETAVLVSEVALYHGDTWFKRIGQLPLLILCSLLIFCAISLGYRGSRAI
ncbi:MULTISPECIES: apolipoprotein N-acyltransferase [Pseudomonadati]|uniref:apolipoprotein N-acyltransferase n=1 Tax=Shewanella aestuarii TaxID=1028752 RepID=UPI0019ADB2C4|nr:apolipoprotein N-acyltransferase [Shewanella aestuarii]